MSVRIEDLLIGAIAKANKAVEDARLQLEDFQRDVAELEALLASHRLRTTRVETTQAAPFCCSQCGQALHQEGSNWLDGYGYARCAGGSGDPHVAVTANGASVDQSPTSISLPQYVPAPPVDAAGAHQLPAETTVTDPAETPKDGA